MVATQKTLSPQPTGNGSGPHGLYVEATILKGRPQGPTPKTHKGAPPLVGPGLSDGPFRVRDSHDSWLIDQLRDATERLDRCQRQERQAREEARRRSAECWDQERELAVIELAEKLHRNPHRVSKQLEQTTQGAAWKIARWKVLGQSLKVHAAWTDLERARAWDLLGLPLGENGPDDVPDADAATLLPIRKVMVEGEIARLTKLRRDVLTNRDERERADACAGLSPVASPVIKALQREAKQAWTQIQWLLARLERVAPNAADYPSETAVPVAVTDVQDEPEGESPAIAPRKAEFAGTPNLPATRTTQMEAPTAARRELVPLSFLWKGQEMGPRFEGDSSPYRAPTILGGNGQPLMPVGRANPIVSFS